MSSAFPPSSQPNWKCCLIRAWTQKPVLNSPLMEHQNLWTWTRDPRDTCMGLGSCPSIASCWFGWNHGMILTSNSVCQKRQSRVEALKMKRPSTLWGFLHLCSTTWGPKGTIRMERRVISENVNSAHHHEEPLRHKVESDGWTRSSRF